MTNLITAVMLIAISMPRTDPLFSPKVDDFEAHNFSNEDIMASNVTIAVIKVYLVCHEAKYSWRKTKSVQFSKKASSYFWACYAFFEPGRLFASCMWQSFWGGLGKWRQ